MVLTLFDITTIWYMDCYSTAWLLGIMATWYQSITQMHATTNNGPTNSTPTIFLFFDIGYVTIALVLTIMGYIPGVIFGVAFYLYKVRKGSFFAAPPGDD
jgi:hypothetical protein